MAVLLLLLRGSVMLGLANVFGLSSTRASQDSERGRMELRRVQSLASQPRYGECWARALEHLDTRCKEMTSESQSRIALKFTHCHLSSSGRDFPACPEGSEVSRCTGGMDAVAFNAYTEFFTHTHSICHFLQSEVWQTRAESTMYRLTESSAGVAEQLQSTRQITEDLIEAQSAALQTQQEILNNGEELKVTLKDSAQGLRTVFSELSSVSREQQVALSELFNRVSFLQSFLMMEAHSLSSCCYNAAALCTAFLLTSTQRSSRARLVLLGLVCLNFYLERKIYQFVMSSDHPEHRHMELVTMYVNMLRRLMVCVALCVLLCVCARYRDPIQQSLQVLQQLRETQCRLQEVLQHAENLGQTQKRTEENPVQVQVKPAEHSHRETTSPSVSPLQRRAESRRREEMLRRRHMELRREGEEEEEECNSDLSHLSHPGADSILLPATNHNALVSPGRRPRRSSASPLVYNILVEDRQRRYSLRSRRSDTH